MPHKSFVIPVQDPSGAEHELNAFLRSHRVLEVDRRWVDQGANSFWAVWVDYLDSRGPADNFHSSGKQSIDWKKILTPPDFEVFSKLRDLRKELAGQDGTALYNVFNNAQLASIVQGRVRTLEALQQTTGVGDARIAKYGSQFLELLNQIWDEFDEESGESTAADNGS